MARQLTKKAKGFADDYIETGNGTQAALKNYDTTDYMTAAGIASENLKKPKVIEYIQDKAQVAAETVFEIVQFGENDTVRLNASKDILDRAGLKAAEKRVNINLDGQLTEREQEVARRLLQSQRD